MIRELLKKDLPVLLEYGKHFWDLTPYVSTGMEYSPKDVEELLVTLDKEHYFRVFEIDGEIVGFLGALISPMIFNPKYLVATELFFYVHPANRGSVGSQLIAQAEADLKDTVDLLSFGEMRSSKDMDEYYTQRGFVHTETTYTKVL